MLAVHLVARGVERRAVGHDDVVAAVRRGIPYRLVLAHEQDGDPTGETAEGGRGDCFGRGFDG